MKETKTGETGTETGGATGIETGEVTGTETDGVKDTVTGALTRAGIEKTRSKGATLERNLQKQMGKAKGVVAPEKSQQRQTPKAKDIGAGAPEKNQ